MGNSQITKDIWDANLYDGSHSFVSKFGNDLVDMLHAKAGERILDLGCGTGDLANRLAASKVNVVGVDNSSRMIQQAKNKFPDILFSVEDATTLKYKDEFDAVFSNATLHWVKSPKKALKCIFKALKQDGRFIAEFGGIGNVQIITDEISNQITLAGYEYSNEKFPWYFPSIGAYTSLMEEVGFKVSFAQHFERPTKLDGKNGLINWINMFAVSMFEGIDDVTKEDILAKVRDNLKSTLYKDGIWIADYKRIRVIGIK